MSVWYLCAGGIFCILLRSPVFLGVILLTIRSAHTHTRSWGLYIKHTHAAMKERERAAEQDLESGGGRGGGGGGPAAGAGPADAAR